MLENGSWGLPPEDPSEVAPSNGPNKFLLQNRVDFVFVIVVIDVATLLCVLVKYAVAKLHMLYLMCSDSRLKFELR